MSYDSHGKKKHVTRVQPVQAPVEKSEHVDVRALVSAAMQSDYGNKLVQAALNGGSVEGLGDLIRNELSQPWPAPGPSLKKASD